MVGTPTRIALACTLLAAPLLGGLGTAEARERHRTLHVHPGPGTPIQDAVDRAHPGDQVFVHPGHYRENVVITTSKLTVVGSGTGKRGSILTPPKKSRTKACEGAAGFCIVGNTGGDDGSTRARGGSRVSDVTVRGFQVRGFSGSGVLGYGTRNLRVEWIRAVRNREYGIASFAGRGTALAGNAATGSEEAGIYLGDSPDASGFVGYNRVWKNGLGILVRDSTAVIVERNLARDNCIGLFALNTGQGAVKAGRMMLRQNAAVHNTRWCAAHDEAPPASGLGIALAGVNDVRVYHNVARDNRPSGPTFASGGIALLSTKFVGGADPRNNRVRRNAAVHNRLHDLYWDRSGRHNVFEDNLHGTSKPRRLG